MNHGHHIHLSLLAAVLTITAVLTGLYMGGGTVNPYTRLAYKIKKEEW